MSVASSFLRIHRVLGKYGEYVCREGFRVQIAVVACVVTLDEMLECSIAITPGTIEAVISCAKSGAALEMDSPRHTEQFRAIVT
jgi:hypothetical protein